MLSLVCEWTGPAINCRVLGCHWNAAAMSNEWKPKHDSNYLSRHACCSNECITLEKRIRVQVLVDSNQFGCWWVGALQRPTDWWPRCRPGCSDARLRWLVVGSQQCSLSTSNHPCPAQSACKSSIYVCNAILHSVSDYYITCLSLLPRMVTANTP